MPTHVATVHTESLPGTPVRLRGQVVVLEGPDARRAASLEPGVEITLGTGDDCALVLTDTTVSRRHATVRAEGGVFVVRDLGSTNGTLYEGGRVTEARVPPGATLKLGHTFVRLLPERRAVEVTPSRARRVGELVGESLSLREVFAVLELAAAGDTTVLLLGETGTGKELAARALHDQGPRRRGPWVAVDCGALPESLLESELFGHVRGAFTGASTTRAGAFARAHGGTIFLDELGAVSPAVQARLLRVLETRTLRPVGADAERAVDVRVIAASRHDLAAAVASGTFRPDLYYRLSVLEVTLPPLRARREDIAPITAEILRLRGMDAGPVEGPNLDVLLGHGWPGNVRELRNVIDRAVTLTPAARSFAALRVSVSAPTAPSTTNDPLAVRTDLPWAEARALVLHAFETRYLREVLARADGNVSAAARTIGLDRKHLRTLLRRHGLRDDPDDSTD